jgi:hypothetical protein
LCNLQRAARSRDTSSIRNWMRGLEPRGFRWQHGWPRWPDADSGPHSDARALYELRQHRPCGLANGNDIDCGAVPQRISDSGVAKRGSDEHRRISRTHGCAQDVLQVASKVVNGTYQ